MYENAGENVADFFRRYSKKIIWRERLGAF
jgi:hypothetical protein